MIKTTSIILVASILAGCASGGANYRPVIDARPGTTVAQQESDLRECQALANQVASGAERAASGAVVGAVLGAILAAALGVKQYTPEVTQGVAMGVAIEGAAAGEKEQRGIISRCMALRGHRTLN
jgi:ABC-type nitrate/sulfonate/bicarbonate transport system permease component